MRISPALILESLRHSVRETFETLSFSEITGWEPAAGLPPLDDESSIGAAIEMRSPRRGRFMILLNRVQCAGFVETACGPEMSGDGMVQDYVNEIANTIVGRFVTALSPGGGPGMIGLPEGLDEGRVPRAIRRTDVSVRFLVEGVPAWCLLAWDRRKKK